MSHRPTGRRAAGRGGRPARRRRGPGGGRAGRGGDRGRRRTAAVRARDAAPALRRRRRPVRNVLVWSGTGRCGVRPPRRHRRGRRRQRRGRRAPRAPGPGLGRLLVQTTLAETPDGRLRLWAHGEHPAAAALAASMGFRQSRALWQMRRSLYAALPPAELPAGVDGAHVRARAGTTRPGSRLNATAFRDHPEQGVLDGRRPAPADGASRGSTRPASSWPSAAARWSGSTGRRCTAATDTTGTRTGRTRTTGTATTRSARSTSSASTRPSGAPDWAGADPRRAAAPAPPRAARRDALRRCRQRPGDRAVHRARLHPMGDRRHVQPGRVSQAKPDPAWQTRT